MRHQKLSHDERIDALDLAAVWPSPGQVAPLSDAIAASDQARAAPAAAVPDMPAAAGTLLAMTYVTLLAALAVATAAPGESLFVIAVCAFFVFMFFGVPLTFLKIEQDSGPRVSWSRFMRSGILTQTGPLSGGAALTQMLIVPVALIFGVTCIGIAAALIF